MEMSDASVLPRELIVEILSWVPVKALMRFRCVSKAWNSLIFDPMFVKLHLERSSENTHILLSFLIETDEDMIYINAPCSIPRLLENLSSTINDCLHQYNLTDTAIFGACNGLVCLHKCEYFFVFGEEFEEHRFQFWNPATRIMSEDSPPFCLPLSYYVKCGFGFDEQSGTYKVVAVLRDIKSQTMVVGVYCMGDTCWRKILTCPPFLAITCCDGQFASGTVNWLALRISSFCYRWETVTIDQLVIFSYDLKNETYRYLLMPEGLVEVPHVESYFGVFKGCLCLSHDHRKTHFVVWLMREFGVEKSWTQLLKVNYDHLQNHDLPPFIGVPLCMSQDEDVVLLASNTGAKFVLYNQRENRIDHTEYFKNKYSFLSYDYVQSLVLPHRN